MIIYVLPLTPIIIAVLLFFGIAVSSIAEVISFVTDFAWVIIFIIAIVTVIVNIFIKTPLWYKFFSIPLSVLSSVMCLNATKWFFQGLVETDTNSIGGTIGFAFGLLFGGAVWLGVAGAAVAAGFFLLAYEEFEGYSLLIAVGLLIISFILGSIFGFYG